MLNLVSLHAEKYAMYSDVVMCYAM